MSPGWSPDLPPVIRVLDVTSGEEVRSYGRRGWPFEVSPDGTTLAYADGTDVVLAALPSGRVLTRLEGPEGPVRQVRFSADGRQLLGVSEDRSVTVWAARSGRTLETMALGPGLFADARFTQDGSEVLAVVEDGLLVYDLDGDDRYVRRVAPPDPVPAPVGWAYRIPSPRGNALAVGLWDPAIQDSRLTVLALPSGKRTPARGRAWVGNAYRAASWSPDGTRLAIYERGGTIRVRNWRRGRTVAQRATDESGELAFLDDARLLVQHHDGAQVLDARTLTPLGRTLSVPGQSIGITLPHPDATSAVLISSQVNGQSDIFATRRRWSWLDLDSGEVRAAGEVTTSVTSAAVSPDGDRLAVAGDGAVQVVDLATGTTRAGVDGDVEVETEHLTYSPDGDLLVSVDSSGRVSLWDGHDGARLGTVRPSTSLLVPTFLPPRDGRNVLQLVGVDGALFEWDTSVEHAVAFACRIVRRGMTENEWRAAFGALPYEDLC